MTTMQIARRMGALSAIAALIAGAPLAASAQSSQKTMLVSVAAEASGPVKNLTAKDFVIREDNTPREVTGAELATEPMSITLMVDTTQPPPGTPPIVQDLRKALSAFVKTIHAASPESQIALMEFGGAAVTRVDFTTTSAELDTAIGRMVPAQQQSAVLLEAVVDASRKLSARPAPRRAIVLVNLNSAESSSLTPRRVAEDVQKSGATLWAVSVQGTAGSQTLTHAVARDTVLKEVTAASGGLHVTATTASALETMLQQVANSLLSQYTVTFARIGERPPKSIRAETRQGGKVMPTRWIR